MNSIFITFTRRKHTYLAGETKLYQSKKCGISLGDIDVHNFFFFLY